MLKARGRPAPRARAFPGHLGLIGELSLVPTLWQGRALALVGIVPFAFSLRSAVASLSPLYDHIAVDFDVPAAVIGLIGTAPPVCYAVFGLLTPALERRFGA